MKQQFVHLNLLTDTSKEFIESWEYQNSNEVAFAEPIREILKSGGHDTNNTLIGFSGFNTKKIASFLRCGENEFTHIHKCSQDRFCEICASKAGVNSYYKYKNSYDKAEHWYHLTIHFDSNVFLNDKYTSVSQKKKEYLDRWVYCRSFVKRLMKNGLISGAVATDELSIASLAKGAVFPHMHAVISSDVDLLEGEILNPYFSKISKACTVVLKPIESAKDLYTTLAYPRKAINLTSIYSADAEVYPIEEVNLGMVNTLSRIYLFDTRRAKTMYIGILHGAARGYVGNIKKKRVNVLTPPRIIDNIKLIKAISMNKNAAELRKMQIVKELCKKADGPSLASLVEQDAQRNKKKWLDHPDTKPAGRIALEKILAREEQQKKKNWFSNLFHKQADAISPDMLTDGIPYDMSQPQQKKKQWFENPAILAALGIGGAGLGYGAYKLNQDPHMLDNLFSKSVVKNTGSTGSNVASVDREGIAGLTHQTLQEVNGGNQLPR